MSGVRVTVSRLDDLLKLRARVDHEIAAERRRLELATPRPTPRPVRPRENATGALLAQLGVTSRDVKEWAVIKGINTEVSRGRVSLQLVQSYAEEHHP